MVFAYRKICLHFLNTPREIHAPDLPRAQIRVAKHYTQCYFKQNKQCYSRGVQQTDEKTCERQRWREQQHVLSRYLLCAKLIFCDNTFVANEKCLAVARVADALCCEIE